MKKRTLSHREELERALRDPKFRRAWQESEPAYQVKRLRILKRLSQTELARRVGTQQPSIARLESGQGVRNLAFLRRVADALDAEVVVQLKPKKARRVAEPRRKRAVK